MAGWSGYSEKGQGSEERGPNTFTFAPPATPQARGSTAVMAEAGYRVAQSVGDISKYNEQDDKTASALFSFAETMLKPVAAEIAARKFLEGQQRAASGEALTEIVNTQPWYSKIFGPSSAVEGARQYSLDAQAAKFDTAVQQAMPTLRNTSPDELPGIIQKMSKEFQTGDPATDAQLGLRLTKVLPNLIQQHTREFYKAQQEHAYNQRSDATMQSAIALQASASNAMASEDDKQLRQTNFLQSFVLPVGVDPDSHKRFIKASLESLAESGNFFAVELALASGVDKELPTEARLKMLKAIDLYRKQHAGEARATYAEQIEQLKYEATFGIDDRAMSGDEVVDAVEGINARYRAASGNDTPVITAPQRSQLIMTAAQALVSSNNASLVAARKAGDAAAEAAQVSEIVRTQNTQAALAAQYPQRLVDQAAVAQFNAILGTDRGMQKPETVQAVAKMLTADAVGGHTVDDIKKSIGQFFNASTDSLTNNFEKGVELLTALETAHPTLKENNTAITKYIDPRQLRIASRYRSELASMPPNLDPKTKEAYKTHAYQIAARTAGQQARSFDASEQKAFDAGLGDLVQGNSWTGSWLGAGTSEAYSGQKGGILNKGWFGNDAPTPHAKALIQQQAQYYYAELADSGLSQEDRMKKAIAYAANSTEIFGKYAWPRAPGRKGLVEELSMHPAADGTAFSKVQLAQGLNSLISERVRGVTTDTPNDIMITRGQDRGGDQQYSALVATDKGMKLIEFSGTEVALMAKQARGGTHVRVQKERTRQLELGEKASRKIGK